MKFAAHYYMYGAGFLKTLQIGWVVLTLAVLAANFRRFFATRATYQPQVAAQG